MHRRSFVRLITISSAAGIIAPTAVLAGSASMAGGLYYTKDAPGRWSKKVDGHLPNIEVSQGNGGISIKVVTLHGMTGYEHYIIKHVVLNQNFEFVEENMFDPMIDKAPVSEFFLGTYSGRIHVLSVCNKHDTWLNLADV
ncbi:MAG: hypothetical protein V3S21_09480 [Xanthomonadales bacterium]